MNQYYRLLDLPNDPLKDRNAILEKYSNEFNGYKLDNLSIIKDDVLETFSKIGLEPDFVVIFLAKLNGEQEKRFLHSDVTYDRETDSWKHVTFGVNWDIQGEGIFQWFDVPMNIERQWPKDNPNDAVLEKLEGIHFGVRSHRGLPQGSTLLDSTSTANPILARTDIAHNVVFSVPRVCVSIRFKNSLDRNWQEIYQLFDNI